ncbi:MAG: hypothetical protein MUO31_01390 [Thermodesulfovibrionales bacterium]|nr:hypothetical protein [Thermodesulfovibrionales bacterium]
MDMNESDLNIIEQGLSNFIEGSKRDRIIKLFFFRKRWFLGKFIPTQYFYSFKKSKIYIKAVLVRGKIKKPFKLRVRRFFSGVPHLLKLPDGQILTFNFKKGEEECISDECITIRFPIPDIYYIGFLVFDLDKNIISEKELSIFPSYFEREDDTIRPINFSKKQYETIIVQDYFSYKVTQLTIWLIVLTGILTILTAALIFLSKNTPNIFKKLLFF